MLPLDRQNRRRDAYRALEPGWQPATEVYAQAVRHWLRPESRVLDWGCGRGGLVEQLGHPLSQIVGIDPDWLSLREHRLPLPRAAGVSQALPLAAASCDLVLASWVLEHLAQPQLDLSEAARVLRPGGVLVFITPNRRHPLISANRWFGRIGGQAWLVAHLYSRAQTDTFPAYYRANTAATLQHLATQAGLTLITLHTIADPTYLAFNTLLFRLACRLEKHLGPERRLHLVGVLRKKA